nr:ORF4 [Epsilontorquevirus sp.]
MQWFEECRDAAIWGRKPREYLYENMAALRDYPGAKSHPFNPWRVSFEITPPKSP